MKAASTITNTVQKNYVIIFLHALYIIILCAHTSIAQVSTKNKMNTNLRANDSTHVESLRSVANLIINNKPDFITPAEQVQLLSAANALYIWTNTYFKPYCSQDAIAIRHYKHLIIAGRFYMVAGQHNLCLSLYEEAKKTIPRDSPLISNVYKYTNEMQDNIQLIKRASKPELMNKKMKESTSVSFGKMKNGRRPRNKQMRDSTKSKM